MTIIFFRDHPNWKCDSTFLWPLKSKLSNTLFVVIIVLSLQSRLKHEKGNGLGESFEILCTFTSVRKCKRVSLN
jgi:hypothetical protein